MTDAPGTRNIVWDHGLISRKDRESLLGRRGMTVWLTGLSGSGKSTIAAALEHALLQQGVPAYRLDGDNIRHGLCSNLGFSPGDRAENIRRVGEVCKLFADAGVIAIASFISPYRADRDAVRAMHELDAAGPLRFIEVYVSTPIGVCESRDPKGLYKKARAGEIKGFTGVDDPYEPPTSPEVVLDAGRISVTESVRMLQECVAPLPKHT